ncbi:DUF6037 family protein [Staphylococcus epidermidis]|uniref:DUF6037 family protein n=1 Tax=Staphylococcus epidermidis TaxID=1282 RepID=UPI00026C19DE|nr:DUF6037 family protein [Staphylococcus epidermidis]EJE04505.1 hypothetical protein HMPREF9983_11493 [Staphylococcus epidermidis NIHLM023]MBF2232610.1 hypothetical protein [Staphylococcus epidermidis]MCG1085164.1 DUF6037 family protein [Staphylococcus epidermidis]MCG2464379.1 DUF6037 family protein [Staphylococcus epidermidis]
MEKYLINLRSLKKSLTDNGYFIELFTFNYKLKNFLVFFRLLNERERELSEYKYISGHFLIKKLDSKDNVVAELSKYVNVNGFKTKGTTMSKNEIKEIREFFELPFGTFKELKFSELYQKLNNSIPLEINLINREKYKKELSRALYDNTKEEDRLYCYDMRRLAVNKHRTIENSEKTKLLRPSLFEKYKEETTISFFYSPNKEDEETDHAIELKYSRRNNN